MQKDVHFYVTYALARKVGLADGDAETIAWADQYTDDLTEADLHGIQTQSEIFGNWADRQIQMSVLVPFHYIPGSDPVHPWMTTRNSDRARKLVNNAATNDLYQLGIALHGLQDTFSHEKFSGWREDLNSCFHWSHLKSGLPNVGHAEMQVIPDVVSYVWTDPRDGQRIDNKQRTLSAAKVTYDFLVKFFNPGIDASEWLKVKKNLIHIFKMDSYDKRVDALCVYSGNDRIDYKDVRGKYERDYKTAFVKAAASHLAEAVRLCGDLRV